MDYSCHIGQSRTSVEYLPWGNRRRIMDSELGVKVIKLDIDRTNKTVIIKFEWQKHHPVASLPKSQIVQLSHSLPQP